MTTQNSLNKQCGRETDRNLVLIGYRATGKTSVGSELARILDRPFVDLDQILVAEAGRSVAEIVAQGGWDEFRRREKDLVARYRHSRGQVLATGGGVVLDQENVEILRENGCLVWLTADPAVIQARLDADRPRDAFRPSLTGGDTVNEVLEVLKFREPLYRAAAQVIIDTTNASVTQVVQEILAALKLKEAANLGG
ncbi:MAG: shikimate kinase AroL [Deltaproteobacteria bacterium]|nr:shikimate kinase AroL [Deltaproteobacteria bacterium]